MVRNVFLSGALLLTLAAFKTAQADTSPLDYRHTLYAPVGQKYVMLEAPRDMCFIDPSDTRSAQNAWDNMARRINTNAHESLLAVFGPCLSLAAALSGADPVSTFGFVTWLNPSVGETTTDGLLQYLESLEPRFSDFALHNIKRLGSDSHAQQTAFITLPPAKDYIADKKVKKDDTSLMIGYTADFEDGYEKKHMAGVTATTLLGDVPIAITILKSGDAPQDLKPLYVLTGDTAAQEIALNK